MASVRLQGITKQFDGNPVLKGIDLDIADGEFVVLVGPSGCGKSTLLRIVAGLEDAGQGSVEIGGRECRDVEPAKRGIAMVFQSYALYPHMTVAENMGFALKLAGQPRAEVQARVARAAAILQIGHLLERRPKALSGGQRQRVAIGRAIVRQPDVFLFDEPLSNLDAALRGQTRVELARLHRELGATMIYVTHDQVEAMTLGQRIVVLNGGRIEQAGTPLELYERPVNQFVAGFLGSPRMNFLPGALAGEEGSAAHVRLPSGAVLRVAADVTRAAPGAPVTLGVRPEHLRVHDGVGVEGGIPGTVVLVEFLGDATIVHVQADDVPGMIAVKYRADEAAPEQDDRVLLAFDHAHGHLFDADGAAFPRAGLPA
ncbi:ABC transporter ATP-binding protein [Massilia yuzhufengensis]|uniref:Multiple sugar transport system ATP-binding protein n=1 Tax=Massilia yuzhufengensis TaxID=1164594 RepID=A0A1I1UL29_9BURK|nr:sn-glycerol-3-phosphate ABC transporter ATP-binding protein UgpC [Massilia yuzhufengensis]SFD71536.1 multiple sugar transport system ATP-binding protein [Massilia yuzhufengensis]